MAKEIVCAAEPGVQLQAETVFDVARRDLVRIWVIANGKAVAAATVGRVEWSRIIAATDLSPRRREIRQAWSCGIPGHEHRTYREAERCIEGNV